MFVQLLKGRVGDAEGLLRQVASWERQLAPGASGWLGSQGGTTSGSEFLAVVEFASAEHARRNAKRADQTEWWEATRRYFGGEVAFHDTEDVTVLWDRQAPAPPGFVQLMEARCRDRQRLETLEAEIVPRFAELRPDALRALRLWYPGDRVVAVDSFRSEAEARAGEAAAMPPDVTEGFQEWMSLLEDVQWHDILQPWVAGPRADSAGRPT